MIFRRSQHSVDPGSGLEIDETEEIWVADFGNHELEEELRQEVLKLKPKSEAGISWILVSMVLLIFIVVTEMALRELGLKMYWSEQFIFWMTWAWRLVILLVWLSVARLKWLLSTDKMFITTIFSFVAAIIILGVIKIVYVKSAWAWINLLVEPLWMMILIALLGALFIKVTKNKSIKN